MRLKDRLKRLLILDTYINSEIRELEELKRISNNLRGIDYTKDRVQSTGQDWTDVSCKIVDKEKEIRQDIDELIEEREKAKELFEELDDVYKVLMIERYLCKTEWSEIARLLNYSVRHVHNLHGNALNILENKIGKSIKQ